MPGLNAASTRDDRLSVSINEAVRLSGVGRTKLYEALNDGSLGSIKLGRRRLIRLAALQDWLAQHETS